ncbi:hypothetical protein Moror_7919 [Moniliophthora roreri MCA 2997]|uniref:Uncharacterized protein n=1 Tax=Moniliophthora roreri (strain MCA 2997) TaxID=1381753 RepID=V2YEA6_MONRO|nr:hypothetical protein Moror_7919 [Moniliophthora roreri MCA 2997]KAI3608932.1 hypothetical protein WG66_010895 [Moniliophthora roreri]
MPRARSSLCSRKPTPLGFRPTAFPPPISVQRLLVSGLYSPVLVMLVMRSRHEWAAGDVLVLESALSIVQETLGLTHAANTLIVNGLWESVFRGFRFIPRFQT